MDGSTTTRVDYGSEEAAMQAYLHDGEKRAATLGLTSAGMSVG